MNILIANNCFENLEAASRASKKFKKWGHFLFTNSAKEAFDRFPEADAVITDLFFLGENHNDGGEFAEYYTRYCSMITEIRESTFLDVRKTFYEPYYGLKHPRHNAILEDIELVLTFMEEGTFRAALEDMITHLREQKNLFRRCYDVYGLKRLEADLRRYCQDLQALPAPQFPYGAVLMLYAKDRFKKRCLVAKIKSYDTLLPNGILLLPLIDRKVLSSSEVKSGNALTYMGKFRDHTSGKKLGKDKAAFWEEAIRRVFKQ